MKFQWPLILIFIARHILLPSDLNPFGKLTTENWWNSACESALLAHSSRTSCLACRFLETRKQFSFPKGWDYANDGSSLVLSFLYTSLRDKLQTRSNCFRYANILARLDDERNKFSVINYALKHRQKHFMIVCLRRWLSSSSRRLKTAQKLVLHERFTFHFEPIYEKTPNENDKLSL